MLVKPVRVGQVKPGKKDRPPFIAVHAEAFAVSLAGSGEATAFDAALTSTVTMPARPYGQIAVSADGAQIAVAGEADVIVCDANGVVATHAVPEWWEENAGGVVFTADGHHVLYTYIPSSDEPEARETIVLGAVDARTGQRVCQAVPRDFDDQAQHALFPLPDGRVLWWANAHQDAQRYAVITFDGTRLLINSHKKANDCPFVRCLTLAGEYLVQNGTAVEWYASKTGTRARRLDLKRAIGDSEVFAAAPYEGDRLLLLVLSAQGQRRLILADEHRSEDVTVEGLDGKALAGMSTNAGRTVIVDERGVVALLRTGRPGNVS